MRVGMPRQRENVMQMQAPAHRNGTASSRYTASRCADWRGSQRISSGLNGTRSASMVQPIAPTPNAAAAAQKSGAKLRSTAPRIATTRAPLAP
jgi:hypothetical protein